MFSNLRQESKIFEGAFYHNIMYGSKDICSSRIRPKCLTLSAISKGTAQTLNLDISGLTARENINVDTYQDLNVAYFPNKNGWILDIKYSVKDSLETNSYSLSL